MRMNFAWWHHVDRHLQPKKSLKSCFLVRLDLVFHLIPWKKVYIHPQYIMIFKPNIYLIITESVCVSGDLFFNWTFLLKVLKTIFGIILIRYLQSCLIIFEQILCFEKVFIILFAISKQSKLLEPGWTRLLDFLV